MKKILLIAVIIVAAGALLIQLIPYGHDHTNPPVRAEPAWDSPQTRALAKRACFDCHSNETTWPWYSSIAPVSWLVYGDVIEGRQHVNFSEWNRAVPQHTNEFQKVYDQHSMPPLKYLLLHPDAKLTDQEYKQLFEGLLKIAATYHKAP